MKLKSILCTALGLATIGFSLPAHAAACQQHFQAGREYGTSHRGPALAFSGKINIKKTYRCPEGTCFSGEMTFENYDHEPDVVTGYWSGVTFKLRRFVGAGNNTQVWSGQCRANSVQGRWYIEVERSNNGEFLITY
jgi:hypothetical protein